MNYQLTARKNLYRVYKGNYEGLDFYFRGLDEQALREVFNDKEYAFLKDKIDISGRSTVLDIGGHIGTFSIWLLKHNPKAKIRSIEADPATYELIRKNTEIAKDKNYDWHAYNRAAGSQDDQLIRFSNSGPSMSHHVDSHGEIEVNTISLHTLINEFSPDAKIDLMKVDIEGAEEDFLLIKPQLLQKIKTLVLEIHPQRVDEDRIRNILLQYFQYVEDVGNRTSLKPLLCCYRQYC